MALVRPGRVTFWFENDNAVLYEVSIVKDTGEGRATKHGSVITGVPMFDGTETALTVDTASLSAWQGYHTSRMARAAVYNTTQDLATILDDAS